MELTTYKPEYRDDIFRMVRAWESESLLEYGIKLNSGALDQTIDQIKDQAFLLLLDGHVEGMLCGKEVYAPASDEKVWHEVVWFVSKHCRRYGVRMLKTVRKILKEQGFTAMVMVYMHNSKPDKLARLYERLGFRAMETNFIGRL